jgi:hypothetical protein
VRDQASGKVGFGAWHSETLSLVVFLLYGVNLNFLHPVYKKLKQFYLYFPHGDGGDIKEVEKGTDKQTLSLGR